jgi:type VI secretion system protein ImpA
MPDFEAITGAVTPEDPSGPDLDSDGDAQYLNFFAGTEPMLPMSYFEVVGSSGERGRFDPKSLDFETQFSAAEPLLARTRDLRLIVLLAKLSILNRDLNGFAGYLAAICTLLETQWSTVHPRDDDGDFTYRAVTIESLDVLPTVVNPIQFQPLIESRRFGTVTYRAYQTATGEIAASGDADLDLATIQRIMAEADLDVLKAISARFTQLAGIVARTKAIWLDKAGKPLSLGRFAGVVDSIAGWLHQFVKDRDPTSIEVAPANPDIASGEVGSPEIVDVSSVTSHARAAAALQAVARYFARSEPSNPARLLIQQALEMVGKSFAEVMRMLIPEHAESAAINIGRDKFFDLPIERMAGLLQPEAPLPENEPTEPDVTFCPANRASALALLVHVATFFRTSEPSSPIPFLIDRARELAQRDFLNLLQDVLPEGALKQFES